MSRTMMPVWTALCCWLEEIGTPLRMGWLLMLIAFSLSLGLPPAAGASVSAPGGMQNAHVAVAPFSRDRTIFDANIANGGNGADIPLSGTTDAPDGTQIEARVVNAKTGAQVHPWTPIATASGGVWAGDYPAVPWNADWLRVEVRAQGSAATAQQATSFGSGLVIFQEGQSNEARGLSTNLETLPNDTITIGNSAGDFQALWNTPPTSSPQTGTSAIRSITDGATYTTSLAAMAKVFHDAAPGLKVMIGFSSMPGSSMSNLLRDAGSDRPWADVGRNGTDGILDVMQADGSKIGVFLCNHFGSLGGTFTDTVSPASAALWGTDFAGNLLANINPDRTIAGGVAVIPEAHGSALNRIWASPDALGDDLLTGRTRWVGVPSGMVKPSDFAGGVSDNQIGDWAIENFPYATARILPRPMRYWGQFQDLRGDFGPADGLHFSGGDLRGMPYRFGAMAHGVLNGVGLINVAPPVFDRVAWDAQGRWVDVWIDGQDVTTSARIKDSATASNYAFVPNSEVLGFALLDGAGDWSNARTEIVDATGAPATAGRVRVYPPAGLTFDGTSVVYYMAQPEGNRLGIVYTGPGAAVDTNPDFADWVAEFPAEHLPIVPEPTFPSHPYGGLIVHPPAPDFISAAGVLVASFFTVSAGSLPGSSQVTGWEAAGTWENNTGATMTVEFRVDIVSENVNVNLVNRTNGRAVLLRVNEDDSLTFIAEDRNQGDNLRWLEIQTAAGVVQRNTPTTIRVAFDHSASNPRYQLWVDGVEVAFTEVTPWTDQGGGRPLNAPRVGRILGGNATLDVFHAVVWADYLTPADRTFTGAGDAYIWFALVPDGAGGVIYTDNSG